MTRAELIKKISRKAGIPDSDVKLFFEILLKRLSSVLKIGQAAYLKEFGYFFLLKGKINQSRLNFIDENVPDTFIDFILFSLNKDLKSSIEEGLIFNVPTVDDDDFQIVDTFFSLSIGKPLIPIRGTSSDEFYVPTGGYELRRLIESKVEKIISEAEILSAYESNPPQIILTSQAFNSNRISLEMTEPELKLDEEIPDSFLETGEVKKEETLRIEHVAWDFGVDLSQEIEEETIIDFQESEAETATELIVEENITQKEPEQITPTEIEQTVEEIINEGILNIKDKIKSEETSVASGESEPITEIVDDSKSEEAIEPEITEEPSAVIPDLENHESIDELIIENPEPEKVEFVYERDEKEDKSKVSALFEEVKPEEPKAEDEQNEFEEVESPLPLIDFDKQKQKEKISDKFEVVNEVDEEKSEEEISPFRSQKEEVKDTPFDEDKELKKVREELYSYQPKKSRVPLLIVIFGSIVIIGMLYFYITQIKNVATKQTEPIVSLKTNNATIVERDFSVPVSYPYPKKEIEETIEPVKIDSSKVETITNQTASENKTVEKTEIIEPVQQKNIVEQKSQLQQNETFVTKPAEAYERVAPNIFKYKDYYVVQVAAFRSNSIAENEAAKFRNKGFNSFVEKAEIQGMGVWFRVRVGNFPTLKEAQDFQSRVKL